MAATDDRSWALLQRQARALGDPTRHQLFRYLAEAAGPVDVIELTTYTDLTHNAVRQHLAKLVGAGLVRERTAAPTGRGRPRLLYELDPSADSRWGVVGPYERLSAWLSEAVRRGDTPVEVGRRVGRRARLGAGEVQDPAGRLVDHMASQGFDPSVRQRGSAIEITLHTCPFAGAATADPDVICQLHLGMAYGIAETAGGLVIDELVPTDPHRASCRLRGHLVDVDADA